MSSLHALVERILSWLVTLLVALAGGMAGTPPAPPAPPTPRDLGGSGTPGIPTTRECDGACSAQVLSQSRVITIVQQAIDELRAQQVASATIAVVDRVGNPLAVYEFGAPAQQLVIGRDPSSALFPGQGLEGARTFADPRIDLSRAQAALSKAGTAAYLSTQGAAFTTRSLSQLIQENFPPGAITEPSGPLFGVQFSQLPCSDIARTAAFDVGTFSSQRAGPKRLPLGLSADPGGVPLYISGDIVGGIGVEIDGVYGVDSSTTGDTPELEELIALAAQRSFQPNPERRADRLTIRGRSLRYANTVQFRSAARDALLDAGPEGARAIDVPGFFQASGGIRSGARLGTSDSGLLLAANYLGVDLTELGGVRLPVRSDGTFYLGATVFAPELLAPDAIPVGGGVSNPRTSIAPTPANGGLTAVEAGTFVVSALQVAGRARAQLRRGLGGSADAPVQASAVVVDLAGNVLAWAESPDAPTFAADVAVQKARTSAFFSRGPLDGQGNGDPVLFTSAADDLLASLSFAVGFDPISSFSSLSAGAYVFDLRSRLGDPHALADGRAFSSRALGSFSRPTLPDGAPDQPEGPFSVAAPLFSPFNTGLQLDLVIDRLLTTLQVDPFGSGCTSTALLETRGGIQTHAGGFPIFKDGRLVGAIGVAGDGDQQDDLVAFLGIEEAGIALGGSGVGGPGELGNAPGERRADLLAIPLVGGGRTFPEYVSCPASPFLESSSQGVCLTR